MENLRNKFLQLIAGISPGIIIGFCSMTFFINKTLYTRLKSSKSHVVMEAVAFQIP